jgi:hypothetical protein
MTKVSELVEVRFTVVDREYQLGWEFERIKPNWQDWLVRELQAHVYGVDVDGEAIRVHKRSQHLATLRFRSVDEVAAECRDEPWFGVKSPCPWVGRVLGYVDFSSAAVPPGWEFFGMVSALAGWVGHLTVGPVIDVVYDPGEVLQPLEEVKFPLTHCLYDKYGFHDGVISTDEKYMDALKAEINSRLTKLGIATRVYRATGARLLDLDKYTPFSFLCAEHPELEPIVDFQGRRIRAPERLLEKELIGLWTYDVHLKDKIGSI